MKKLFQFLPENSQDDDSSRTVFLSFLVSALDFPFRSTSTALFCGACRKKYTYIYISERAGDWQAADLSPSQKLNFCYDICFIYIYNGLSRYRTVLWISGAATRFSHLVHWHRCCWSPHLDSSRGNPSACSYINGTFLSFADRQFLREKNVRSKAKRWSTLQSELIIKGNILVFPRLPKLGSSTWYLNHWHLSILLRSNRFFWETYRFWGRL